MTPAAVHNQPWLGLQAASPTTHTHGEQGILAAGGQWERLDQQPALPDSQMQTRAAASDPPAAAPLAQAGQLEVRQQLTHTGGSSLRLLPPEAQGASQNSA